jgi:hypothetical protein
MNATNDDIRRLLRNFGMQADQAMQAQATRTKGVQVLKFRLVVEDVTDYGGPAPTHPPHIFELEGEVHV